MEKSEAYYTGFDACYDGIPKEENPHVTGSQEAIDWADGWVASDEVQRADMSFHRNFFD